ncbi:hypothetical protein D9M71_705620 [compost metagenome]
MNGGDAARVAGAPGLDQVQRLAAPYLANHHPIGAQAQRGAHQVSHAHHTRLGTQGDVIEGRALQLDRVLEYQHAVTRAGHFGKQGVGQGGLAGAGAAGHEDVLPLTYGDAQVLGLSSAEDAFGDVLSERDDAGGALAQGEGRAGRHRRQHRLETLAGVG